LARDLGCERLRRATPDVGGWQKRWFVLDGPAGTLSYYREKDARSMFEEMDADGSGYLDMQEVEQLCKQLGKKLSKKEMQLAMGEMDRDGNGEVSFPEFEAWWTVHCEKQAGKRDSAGTIDLHNVVEVRSAGGVITLKCGGGKDGQRVYELQTVSVPTNCTREPLLSTDTT
jgi:centrin-1